MVVSHFNLAAIYLHYLDCQLGLHNYNIHRRDRKSGRGGGVLLAVHKDGSWTRFIGNLFCEIQQRMRDSVLFGVLYRPPGANMDFSVSFWNCLDKISRTLFSSVILAGDFNFPSIVWHTVSPTLSDPHTLDFAPTRTVNGQWHSQYSGPDLDNFSKLDIEYSSDPRWFCVWPSSCVVWH